jgi:hypothetical protein
LVSYLQFFGLCPCLCSRTKQESKEFMQVASVPLARPAERFVQKTPWSESASELYRPSDRRLSAKWLPTFADRGFHVVSMTDPYGRILGFLGRSRYFSIK